MSTKLKAGTATSGAVIDADTAGVLEIQTGSTPTTALTIDASQNVGIGTTSPAQKLDVSGTLQSQYNAGTNDAVVGAYNFYNTNASASANPIRASIVAGRENSAWGAYLQFNTSTGTSAVAERMRIDSSGNLLVGTTSQIGSGFVNIKFNSGPNNGITMQDTATSGWGQYIYFINSSSAQAGLIGHTGSTTVAYTTSSDYRLKEDVASITGALDKVLTLKPVTYKWKEDGSIGEGFIAHELAKVCPQAVIGEKDAVNQDGSIKAQSIDTSFLVATLTASIQELKAIVDAQGEEIKALKGAK